MLRAVLLPMLILGSTPADSGRDPAVRLFLGNGGQYAAGDRAHVEVQAADDGYLLVVQVDPERRVRVLFPIDPTDDNYVRGGRLYTILGRGDREGFPTDLGGDGVVFAAISADPWRFDRYTLNDHWDFRTLNADPVSDAEAELVDLANRLSVGRFDYDILPYTVIGPATYANEGSPADVVVEEVVPATSTTTVILGGCLSCGTWGLYDPFFYDPWYWRAGIWGPVWVAPVWWNTWSPWWGPGWGGGWSGGWGGGWRGSWGTGWSSGQVAGWQYRPKAWDRQWAGRDVPYRDRWARGALAATNTVVGPMPATGTGRRIGFRDRLADQPAVIRNDGFATVDRPTGRRTEGSYQGARPSPTSGGPGTRTRQDPAPSRRRDVDQGAAQQREGRRREVGRDQRGLAEVPPNDSRRQGQAGPPTRRPSVVQRDQAGTRQSAPRAESAGRGQRVQVEGREPVRREVDRGGARTPQAQRREPERRARTPEAQRREPEGRARTPEAQRREPEGRAPTLERRGGGTRQGAPSVRAPSGSGRSGGPTPSAPRSGGQSSSRRR